MNVLAGPSPNIFVANAVMVKLVMAAQAEEDNSRMYLQINPRHKFEEIGKLTSAQSIPEVES